jgi:hypothetical protein
MSLFCSWIKTLGTDKIVDVFTSNHKDIVLFNNNWLTFIMDIVLFMKAEFIESYNFFDKDA